MVRVFVGKWFEIFMRTWFELPYLIKHFSVKYNWEVLKLFSIVKEDSKIS